jgi:hypothetical protein
LESEEMKPSGKIIWRLPPHDDTDPQCIHW